MGRELIVVWPGRPQRDEWEALCERYRGRIGRWTAIRDLPVRAGPRRGPSRVRQESEGEALLAALPEPCWTIGLDRRARALDSKGLAARLRDLSEDWPHPVAFLIGSDLGLSRAALERCRERLSLGPLTLPHELARLVLYEQLYRALSILAGIKYHREPL
jgi:23S rRNA (pseudouridine1915-N3)-methyltransferase